MLKGIDINQRIEFSSAEDTSEPKTIFVFRPLSGADMIGLSTFASGGQLSLSGDAIVDMLDQSIVEIKNFDGPKDKREALKTLPASVLSELVNESGRINNLTDDDKKNS